MSARDALHSEIYLLVVDLSTVGVLRRVQVVLVRVRGLLDSARKKKAFCKICFHL